MIPKMLEKWVGVINPAIKYHTLGFKTKSAAKRFLRTQGAEPARNGLSRGWYCYANGREARLFKSYENHKYPWIIHEVHPE